MSSPERLLIVTYRYGPGIPGGAERHVAELVRLLNSRHGIECEVWTTDAEGLSPVAHWGTMLEPRRRGGGDVERGDDGVAVRRFPLRRWPRSVVALGCKTIQRQWEREETAIDPERFLPFGVGGGEVSESFNSAISGRFSNMQELATSSDGRGLIDPEADLPDCLPGPGWHHPEPQPDGGILRWTMPWFSILRKAGGPAGRLIFSGFAPRRTAISATQGGVPLGERRGLKGWFTLSFDLPPGGRLGGAVEFQCDGAFTPWTDHRSLGLMIGELSFRPVGLEESVRIPHWTDYRALLRRRWDDLIDFHIDRASRRPDRYGALFDWVRGPRCPSLWKALRDPAVSDRFDGVLAANLPWGVIPGVAESCSLPLAALALWHLDDEFYYWNHYIRALQNARVVLSNTKWAAETVWPRMGVNARWAGPGVDSRWASEKARKPRGQWLRDLGLVPDAPVILSVARKSPAKRYDLLLEAVERLRSRHPGATLVLVGPDEDHRPVNSPVVVYTGPMNDADLHDAYCSADAFAMMSESESFGMVFVESWMREVPVVGNRWCGPVASLIDHGRDGFLASGVEDLAGALDRLLSDAGMRREFGRAGKAKTLRDHTWNACADRVAAALRECVFR